MFSFFGGVLDFSSTPEELAQQNSQELNSAMGSSFDVVDFYPTDDALRGMVKSGSFLIENKIVCFTVLVLFSVDLTDGLDPIDFDGLQILTNSTLVTDPSTEDHFRLDRM